MMCASGHIGTPVAGDGNGSVLGRWLHSIDLGGSGDDVLLQHLNLGCLRWERCQAAEHRPSLGHWQPRHLPPQAQHYDKRLFEASLLG